MDFFHLVFILILHVLAYLSEMVLENTKKKGCFTSSTKSFVSLWPHYSSCQRWYDAVSANKNRLMSGYSLDIFGDKNEVPCKSDCSCPLTTWMAWNIFSFGVILLLTDFKMHQKNNKNTKKWAKNCYNFFIRLQIRAPYCLKIPFFDPVFFSNVSLDIHLQLT